LAVKNSMKERVAPGATAAVKFGNGLAAKEAGA